MAEMRIPAECLIRIEDKELRYSIYSFELIQRIDHHHLLKVELRPLSDKPSSQSDFIDSGEITPFLGKPVSVTLTPAGGLVDPGLALKFLGLVDQTQMRNNVGEINQILLTAKSPTCLMDTAAKNRLYNEKSLNEIISGILSQYPIDQGTMDIPSSIKYKFCVQYGETDYQFIKRLAEQEGLWAYYDGTRFCMASRQGSETVKLTWRDNLATFALSLGCRQQLFERKVYNYEEKRTYSQNTKSVSCDSNPSGIFKIPLDASESMLPGSGVLDFPKQVDDQKMLDDYLSVKKSESREKLVSGSGESSVPALSAGIKVEIKNMIRELEGQYLVTEVIHHLDHSGNYHNRFECVPVDLAYPRKTKVRSPIEGLHSAVVTANDDPDHLGRVKVKFQWNKEGEESPWIRVLTAHAGKDRGVFCLPEVGDEVLVSFDQDYPESPIVLGSLYNKVDAPRGDVKNPENEVKAFITKSGNQVIVTDTKDKEEILINTPEGKNSVSLKMGNPPQISVHSEGKISLDAEEIILQAKKKLSLISDGEAELTSKKSMKIEGQGVDMTAQQAVKIKGQNAEVAGQMGVKIQGMTAEMSGQTSAKIKALKVDIN
jgi:type VI secretion system secreted protein VgrG